MKAPIETNFQFVLRHKVYSFGLSQNLYSAKVNLINY